MGGKPSQERLKVLHREALELALYTFRYLPDVEGVVTLLPPPPPEADGLGDADARGRDDRRPPDARTRRDRATRSSTARAT